MAKYCSIGGQALIEGVMMRGKDTSAIAVRKLDKTIETKTDEITGISKSKILKIPFIRGSIALISSMIIGMKALMWSAEFFEVEDDVPDAKDAKDGEASSSKPKQTESRFEKFLEEKFGDKIDTIVMGISVIIAFSLAFLLFAVVPTTLISFSKTFIKSQITLSALEGITKIIVFMAYITIISKNKDIRRVFEYHGAEHKTIHCYEAGEELTVANAKKFTTLHPRCGTSFILIVLVVSIIVFTFVSWDSVINRIILKVILLPLISGVSYEVIKWTGAHDNLLSKVVSFPGLMLQKLTTREPDEEQLEIAITAMRLVLEKEAPERLSNCEV